MTWIAIRPHYTAAWQAPRRRLACNDVLKYCLKIKKSPVGGLISVVMNATSVSMHVCAVLIDT